MASAAQRGRRGFFLVEYRWVSVSPLVGGLKFPSACMILRLRFHGRTCADVPGESQRHGARIASSTWDGTGRARVVACDTSTRAMLRSHQSVSFGPRPDRRRLAGGGNGNVPARRRAAPAGRPSCRTYARLLGRGSWVPRHAHGLVAYES
jgi:hypothetical protein